MYVTFHEVFELSKKDKCYQFRKDNLTAIVSYAKGNYTNLLFNLFGTCVKVVATLSSEDEVSVFEKALLTDDPVDVNTSFNVRRLTVDFSNDPFSFDLKTQTRDSNDMSEVQ